MSEKNVRIAKDAYDQCDPELEWSRASHAPEPAHVSRAVLTRLRATAVLTALCVAAALSLLVPARSDAIIGGELDGNRHPNVGLIIGCGEGCQVAVACSGTLISPTIVLTAAHCVEFPGLDTFFVTFDPDPFSGGLPELIQGEAHPHPNFSFDAFTEGQKSFQTLQRFDIAVVELDEAPNITPAPLPSENVLEPFTTGGSNQLFTIVGYGSDRDIEPPLGKELLFDGKRRTTTVPLMKLTDTLIFVRINPNDVQGGGGGCFGDSGGPILHGETVVGEFVAVQAQASATGSLCQSYGFYVRIDTGPAREFLGQFVTLP
jgi:hypothetical protein